MPNDLHLVDSVGGQELEKFSNCNLILGGGIVKRQGDQSDRVLARFLAGPSAPP